MYFVYFLRSESRPTKVYTGYTNDLDRRLQEHNDANNTGYTRQFQPWRIEACVLCDSEEAAGIVEAYFKNSAGQEKFDNFAKANPHHPSPKQGFFDTVEEGRGFGSKARRFHVTKDGNKTVMALTNAPLATG